MNTYCDFHSYNFTLSFKCVDLVIDSGTWQSSSLTTISSNFKRVWSLSFMRNFMIIPLQLMMLPFSLIYYWPENVINANASGVSPVPFPYLHCQLSLHISPHVHTWTGRQKSSLYLMTIVIWGKFKETTKYQLRWWKQAHVLWSNFPTNFLEFWSKNTYFDIKLHFYDNSVWSADDSKTKKWKSSKCLVFVQLFVLLVTFT